MTKQKTHTLEAPYGFRTPDSGSGEAIAFKFRDHDHTPYNSTRGGSIALMNVQTAEGPHGKWASFRVEESTKDKNDVWRSRVISVSLDAEAVAALIGYLQSDGKA